MRWIHDEGCGRGGALAHHRNMLRSGAMTSLAGDAWNESAGIELVVRSSSRGMAAEAERNFFRGHVAAESGIEARGRGAGVTHREI